VPFVVWILSSNRLFVGLIVPEILRVIDFGVLAWNCLFTPLLVEFWDIFSPYKVTHRPNPKRTVLGRKHIVWAIQRKNRRNDSTWAHDKEKKDRITKKSQKCYISLIWGGSPHWNDSTQTLHGGLCSRRNHMCQVSNWNLHGLQFYRGSNFRFYYWFLHRPYNSAALMRCLDRTLRHAMRKKWRHFRKAAFSFSGWIVLLKTWQGKNDGYSWKN